MHRPPDEGDQRRPAPRAEYHVVEFEPADEARAFVAALSRFLESPRGRASLASSKAIEVWALPRAGAALAELYLSDGALLATDAAFGRPPVERVARGDALDARCALVIDGARSTLASS